MEESRNKCDTCPKEDTENIKPSDSLTFNSSSNLDQEPNVSSSLNLEFQKSSLPNTSFDDSPFMSFKSTKLRRKKTQTKLTFVREFATRRKKTDVVETDKTHNNSRIGVDGSGISSLSQEASSNNTSLADASDNDSANTLSVCPVCWRSFGSKGEQMQHMKACAAKHNLTLKQLLDALDLQAKQIKERTTLGLPSVPTANVTKKSTSKKTSTANDKDDPDLQLGLALSVSMSESEDQKLLVEQEVMLEAGLSDEVAAKQASLLERFGFTSSRPILPSVLPRTKPGKTKLRCTPALLLRSQDERERLITEKVAILLTNEEKLSSPFHEVCQGLSEMKHELQSDRLSEFQQKKCSLWRKASTSPYPKDSCVYYVEPLSYVISPSTTKTGSKLKHLSQVPCRLKTPERYFKDETRQDSPVLQNSVFAEISVSGLEQNEYQITPNIQRQYSENTLRLAGDWRKLLNEESRSDLKIIVSDNRVINVHELVLFVRCPNILKDIKQENDSVKCIMWCEISFNGAFAFLEYIYSGSTYKINESREYLDEIFSLSRKYCVRELCSHLKCLIDAKKNVSLDSSLETNDVSSHMRQYGSELYNAEKSESAARDESQTEQLIVPEENEKGLPKKDDGDMYFDSVKKQELSSPDPFLESLSPNKVYCYHNKITVTPDTQQIMNDLLHALSDDEMEVHQNLPNCEGTGLNTEKLETCGSREKSPPKKHSITTQNDGYATSSTKKRKLADSLDTSSSKLICKNDRTARKSLLQKFVDEQEQSFEDNETQVEMSQIICSTSEKGLKSVGRASNSDGTNGVADVVDCEEVDVQSKIQIDDCSHVEDKSSLSGSSSNNANLNSCSTIIWVSGDDEKCDESLRSSNSVELQNNQDSDNEINCDVLGDLCADYEYQNFCASYSPFKEISSPLSHQGRESTRQSPSGKEAVSEVISLASPFSSPHSVKSLPRGGSSPFCQKKRTEKKLRRVGSCSDVSVISCASTPSPVSLRCFSQSSIHLKSSDNMNKDDVRVMQSSSKNNATKSNVSSGRLLDSVTPTSVQKTPRSSLSSIKRLLEDSFCTELEKNFKEGNLSDNTGGRKCSTPTANPSEVVLMDEDSVTPLADYSAMNSPMLKRELQKFGLKPMKPKRAKQMLRYIYNELHPLAPEQPVDDILQSVNNSMIEDEISFHSSQGSSSSSRCEFEVPEDLAEDSAVTQSDISELPSVVHNYITSNPNIHEMVLLYEPISLEQLQNDLRAQNHKFKLNELMEYLDRECITFRTAQGNRKKKKQKEVKNRE